MPCTGGGPPLEPTPEERTNREAAQLLVWLVKLCGVDEPKEFGYVKKAADDEYGGDYDCVPVLCAIVGRLSKDKREKLFFHKNRKMGRRLEAWWEDHEEKDRKRRDRERAEREREKLVDAAMTKLSSSELSALRRFFREDLG